MAETLGSLIDKLSIKNLRLWHMDEMLTKLDAKDAKAIELREKRQLVLSQSQELIEEINGFLALALAGKIKIRDQKVKLYQNLNVANTDGLSGLGSAVSELALRNIRLWHLEDEVRCAGIADAQAVSCKRKIDTANQERNNLIDKIDEILAAKAAKPKAARRTSGAAKRPKAGSRTSARPRRR